MKRIRSAMAAMALAGTTSCGGAAAPQATQRVASSPAEGSSSTVTVTTDGAEVPAASETHGPWSEGMSATAPNRFVQTEETRFAYRSFGRKPGVPLLFLAPLGRTMDFWDATLIDALARDHLIILLDNTGVGLSSGDAPRTVAETAKGAEAFIDGLKELHFTDSDWADGRIDLLGYGLGGFVAQQFAIDRPDLVERVVLAGTGPQGGDGLASPSTELTMREAASSPPADGLLRVLFAASDTSQAAGRAFIDRMGARQRERDAPPSFQSLRSQLAAVKAWGERPTSGQYAYLIGVREPVLVADGDADVVMPTSNSKVLAQNLPKSKLIIYPDSAHAFLFQYPETFARDVSAFLRRGRHDGG